MTTHSASAYALLTDGGTVRIRPAMPEDAAAELG